MLRYATIAGLVERDVISDTWCCPSSRFPADLGKFERPVLRKPRCSRFYSESQHLTRLDTRRPRPRSLHASFIKYGHIVPDVLTNIDNYQAHWSHTNLSDFSVVAAYECIAVMDLQTLVRSTPVLREIQFQQCSFYSRRLLEAAVVNVVSAWK